MKLCQQSTLKFKKSSSGKAILDSFKVGKWVFRFTQNGLTFKSKIMNLINLKIT